MLKGLKSALLLVGLLLAGMAMAAEGFKPFVASTLKPVDLDQGVQQVREALKQAGFQVLADYAPKKNTRIVIVSHPALLKAAAQSARGGFGAVERVALVKRKKSGMHVGYTNPDYWFHVMRLKGDIAPVRAAMEKALGNAGQYGSKKAFSADELRSYRYMGMPDFADVDELYTYKSHKEGVEVIERNLAKGVAGVKKVYRVDIPGTEMTVWGVQFTEGPAADRFILKKMDRKGKTHAAHLPYELLLDGKQAVALKGEFRIAISWPTSTMFKFMRISRSPDAIEEDLLMVTNPKGKLEQNDVMDEL